jgi:hypothetical protein
MPDKNKGLYEKYAVTRHDGKPIGKTFVLEYERDPFAITAINAYITALRSCVTETARESGGSSFDELADALKTEVDRVAGKGMRCRLDCPHCGAKHVDCIEAAPHENHTCHSCNKEWQPFYFRTLGISE